MPSLPSLKSLNINLNAMSALPLPSPLWLISVSCHSFVFVFVFVLLLSLSARHPFVVDVPVSDNQSHSATADEHQPGLNPPTDFAELVVHVLAHMSRKGGGIDQPKLRHCLGMAPSYLLADTCTSTNGFATWSTGLSRLVDVMTGLHARNELELATMDAAARACAECWGIAGTWKGMGYGREGVRAVALKLKTMLDQNGQTYRGEMIYGAK
jgi:hypothetical protein